MRSLLPLTAFLLTLIGNTLAQVTAVQSIEREVTEIAPDGERVTKRIEADIVEPGETLFYTLKYANGGQEAAEDIVLVMNVPPEVTYVEGSALADRATVTFSADGGRTYMPRGRLTVAESGGVRAATGDDITNVKFNLGEPLPAGAEGVVTFKAILK